MKTSAKPLPAARPKCKVSTFSNSPALRQLFSASSALALVVSVVYNWRFTLALQRKTTMKHLAVYVRVSSNGQDTKSQEPDLRRWAEAQDMPVKWYRDQATGKNMIRPAWTKLEAAIRQGKVA